ncbi:MAG: hypothetical protein SOZ53_00980 [Candidatus Onthovivens sp.]|nr:hypothetical protein [Candidatus Onthovivens sp.]
MKRLIKKSELVDTQRCEDGGITNLYKNPTSEEIDKALDQGYGEIRGLITSGEVYAWKGSSLHYSAGKTFGLDTFSVDNLYFTYSGMVKCRSLACTRKCYTILKLLFTFLKFYSII